MARNTNTNTAAETVSDDGRYFRFPLLKIGAYDLAVSAPGFTEFRQTGIELRVSQQARINIAMKVGALMESVTVTADAAMVDVAGQQAQGEVMNERAVRNLPMTSRNVYNFHLLAPGVKEIPSTGFGTTQILFGGHNRSTWSVDGLDNSQRRFNRQIRLVISTPEAVEEMQVMSGAYSAEFGRAAGGIINVVTRSGTNDLHGGAMWFYRPSDAAARPPLAATKPNQTWWMTAANISGPVKRDRMWFFINDEYIEGSPAGYDRSGGRAKGKRLRSTSHRSLGSRVRALRNDLVFQSSTVDDGIAACGDAATLGMPTEATERSN